MLTGNEQLILTAIGLLVFGSLILNYSRREYYAIFSPVTILALIYVYYVIIGPLRAIFLEGTVIRLVEHRDFIINGWNLALMAFIAFLVGFQFTRRNKVRTLKPVRSDPVLHKYGLRLFWIVVIILVVLFGTGGLASRINVFEMNDPSQTGYQGEFRNYLLHSMNFLIATTGILLITALEKRTSWWVFTGVVLLALALYTNEGFRFRHVLLGISLFAVYYLYRRQKPSLVVVAVLITVGIGIMGYIGLTRVYGRGLDIGRAEETENTELISAGLGESTTFLTTGFLVEMVPEMIEYVGWDPVIQALVMPVPRILWPGKPSGDYIFIMQSIYGQGIGYGSAVLNFGEYYMAFGNTGVIVGYFLLGFGFGWLWAWFVENRDDRYAIVLYAVTVSSLYVIVSRGYLPQVVMIFVFTVGPMWLIWRAHKKKMLRGSYPRRRPNVQVADTGSES